MKKAEIHQVTVQDYRDTFINEYLPLTAAKVHRSVLQCFSKQQKEFGFNLTTRNIFDYLLFNANHYAQSSTFGEVSDVLYSDIANYLGKKERTVENEILKLVRAGLIERHPTKRRVFIIPSMTKARDELIAQSKMKKAMRVSERAEQRLSELEKDGIIVTHQIRSQVYTDEQAKVSKNGNGNGNGNQPKLPFE